MSDVRDFDAFWAEREAGETEATLEVRFEGRPYHVPASPSAPVVLRVAQLQRQGSSSYDPDTILTMAEGMLGKENVRAITEANPTLKMPKLFAFLTWVSDLQTGQRPKAKGRANPRSSTSSKRGATSRRTSSASTGSTFAAS